METRCAHGAGGWCDDCWERRRRRQLAEELDRSTVPDDLWAYLVAEGFVDGLRNDPDSWPAFLQTAETALGFAEWRGATQSRGFREAVPSRAQGIPMDGIAPDLYEDARARVFANGLAFLAGDHPRVSRFRNDALGGGTLSPNAARAFVASPLAGLISRHLIWSLSPRIEPASASSHIEPAPPHDHDGGWSCVVVVVQPGGHRITSHRPPERRPSILPFPAMQDEPVYYLAGSLLAELHETSRKLVRLVPVWNEGDAVWFVLTGEAPEVPPLHGETRYWNGRSHGWEWASITLHVEPWVSAERVAALYRMAQERVLPKRSRRRDAGLAAWLFKLEQERAEGSALAVEELNRRWNAAHSAEKDKYRERSGGFWKAVTSGEKHSAIVCRPGYVPPSARRAAAATPIHTPKPADDGGPGRTDGGEESA